MKITKLGRTEIPEEHLAEYEGLIAFEMVRFESEFYGSKCSFVLDTAIRKDGTQYVIDGNGFIKSGTEIYED